MKMESQTLDRVSDNREWIDKDDNSAINEIKMEIQERTQANIPENVEGVRTIQLQSSEGGSSILQGIVVTNSASENSCSTASSQIHSAMDQGIVGSDGIFLDDSRIPESLSEENTATGQILMVMKVTADENGETIIFVQPQETENELVHNKSKKRKKNPGIIASRRQRCQEKMNQIQNLLNNSSFQHLIRRDLDEDSLEYMAERLLTTKSNSSVKLKEIENMILERMRNVFCDDCRKTVLGGKEGYHKHRKLEHKDTEEDLTIPCDICGNFYPEKDLTGLSQNYFAHWINHFYFEECSECHEKCPNENLLKKHKLLHEKRPGYPCPQCDKVLSKKITLEQHIKTHLPEEEKMKNALKCEICGKTITAPTLKAHMFSVHSGERPWKCEVCGARFKHKSDLNGHRNAVHLKIKNYICNICGKSFGHHCGLRVHIMSHENKRNHCCTTCGKRFLTLWHLKKHIVTHKEVKDIICSTCGKGFKKEESLQEHMTIHTGEMPYECHICGRKVRVLSNLYKHFMVHKKNKTYYSKKDGLPDPLDAYIVEQQKKKSVNKIVLEAEEARTLQQPGTEAGNSSQGIAKIDEDDIIEFETELQVNRSTDRVITYRGRSTTPKVKPSVPVPQSSSNPLQTNKSTPPPPPDKGNFSHHVPPINAAEAKKTSTPSIRPQHGGGGGSNTNWPKLGPVIISNIDQITTRSSARPS